MVGEHAGARSPRASRSKPAARRLEIAYLLEGLPQDRRLHFARRVQFRRPARRRRRSLFLRRRSGIGSASSARSSIWPTPRELGLVDEWLGIDVDLTFSRRSSIWTFPVETRQPIGRRLRAGPSVGRACSRTGSSAATPKAAGRWRSTWRSTPRWPKAATSRKPWRWRPERGAIGLHRCQAHAS